MSEADFEGAADAEEASDGRLRRAQRSRERMVHALFELVGEGELRPTAQQVAVRAGVGLRSVFRHFSDMDSLFAELDALLQREGGAYLDSEPIEGTLSERALQLFRERVRTFERFEPYLRSTRLNRSGSSFLSRRYSELAAQQRISLARWLPELASEPRDLADAMAAAMSFELWDDMRVEAGLGKPRCRAALERMVEALVASFTEEAS